MRSRDLSRYALSICIAAAMISGCGGHVGGSAVPTINRAGNSSPYQQTFGYTGAEQSFALPTGVTEVTITESGASGSLAYTSGVSGLGGLVKATIPVTPGETLEIFVGGEGAPSGSGYNGGAYGARWSGSARRGCIVYRKRGAYDPNRVKYRPTR